MTDAVDDMKDAMMDGVTDVTQGLDTMFTGGMTMAKEAKDSMAMKAEEMGDDLMATKDNMMAQIPSKADVDAMMEKSMAEADQMADDLIADTQSMVTDVSNTVAGKVAAVIPNVSTTRDDNDNNNVCNGTSKTPTVQSMDSFKTGSPEPELQNLGGEDDESRVESPKPTTTNMLELVDLEAPMTMTTTTTE